MNLIFFKYTQYFRFIELKQRKYIDFLTLLRKINYKNKIMMMTLVFLLGNMHIKL